MTNVQHPYNFLAGILETVLGTLINALLSYCLNIPLVRALSHNNHTRLVFYFLNIIIIHTTNIDIDRKMSYIYNSRTFQVKRLAILFCRWCI